MTRLPQLEQELVAAAARLQSPRRMVAPARRVAIAAAGAVLAVLALGLLVAGDRGGGEPARDAAGPAAVAPDAQLEDVLGIFRRPATAADHMGDVGRIPDRQPGEDPSRSRRVEWPGETIFVWPMRDGVCYSVRSGGACPPLDHLRREGVAVGIQSAQGRNSVSGLVVDGIDEVVLAGPGGVEATVPVRDNFFFVDLKEEIAERVSWTYAGEERSFEVARFLAESTSEPLDFAAYGVSYTAVGYYDKEDLVCVRLTRSDSDKLASEGCLNELLLRDELPEKPAHVFSGGGVGGDPEVTMHTGYARADVVEVRPRNPASDMTVVLSEPWRPAPWEGAPIRLLLAFDRGDGTREHRVGPSEPLEARLEDGTVLPLPAP